MGLIETVQSFFESVFSNAYLVGFIISIIPLIELKGGIIYMIAKTGNIFLSFLVGVIGASIVAPLLLLIFIPLINWMKTTRIFFNIAVWLERHFKKKSDALQQKASAQEEGQAKKAERVKYFGLFVFTAIPLPLTGCWTASVVAALLGLDYKKSLLFIVLGNIVAGVAITVLGGILNIAFFR